MRYVGKATGWKGEVVVVPEDCLPEHLRLGLDTDQHLVTDTSRSREELSYDKLVFREEAFKSTVAWERENPPEKQDPRMFDYEGEDAVLAGLESQE